MIDEIWIWKPAPMTRADSVCAWMPHGIYTHPPESGYIKFVPASSLEAEQKAHAWTTDSLQGAAVEIEALKEENAKLCALLVRALPAVDQLATREAKSNEVNTHSAEITYWQDVWADTCAALAQGGE